MGERQIPIGHCAVKPWATTSLIGHLNLGKADVMGYSLGSSVALQTAIRHPDVVDRLILVAARMRQDGAYPEVIAAFARLEANAAKFGGVVKASPLGQAYPHVRWTKLFSKVDDHHSGSRAEGRSRWKRALAIRRTH